MLFIIWIAYTVEPGNRRVDGQKLVVAVRSRLREYKRNALTAVTLASRLITAVAAEELSLLTLSLQLKAMSELSEFIRYLVLPVVVGIVSAIVTSWFHSMDCLYTLIQYMIFGISPGKKSALPNTSQLHHQTRPVPTTLGFLVLVCAVYDSG